MMKMNYEEPTAKFIGFAPAETIASDWQWHLAFEDDSTEDTSSMFDVTVSGNPEGDY